MGHSKKLRPCPAANCEITFAECGEHRQSRYACPESCAFNPFAPANYASLLELEDMAHAATLQQMFAEQPNDPELRAAFAASQREKSPHAIHAAIVQRLFIARDAHGRTFAERGAAGGWPELENDQRTLLRHKMRIRVALLEVHRVLDGRRFEAVDLLDPGATPMVFVDPAVAGQAVRFSTYFAWIYPLPHFWRISGKAIAVPEIGRATPTQILEACVAHLGGPTEHTAQRAWLAEHFVPTERAMTATAGERRERALIELQKGWGVAAYEVCAPFEECRAALAAGDTLINELVNDDEREEGILETVVWVQGGSSESATGAIPRAGAPNFGRVFLGQREWRLEGLGAVRFSQLRERFEAKLGARLRFLRHQGSDLITELAELEPVFDHVQVVRSLLEQPLPPSAGPLSRALGAEPDEVAAMLELGLAWLDRAAPLLDGRTPREAAHEPARRACLLAWIKFQMRRLDERNLRDGRADDISGIVRELGLAELDFPAPPRREPPSDDGDDATEGDPALEERTPFSGDTTSTFGAATSGTQWSAPPLPLWPLTIEEANLRVMAATDAFAGVGDALQAMDRMCPSLIEDTWRLAQGGMNKEDFARCLTFLAQVWFALVPRDTPSPVALRFEALEGSFQRSASALNAGASGPPLMAFQQILNTSPQPKLLEVMIALVVEAVEKAAEHEHPTPGAPIETIFILHAVIAEIDHALRGL